MPAEDVRMPERRRVTVVNDNPEFLDLVHDILTDERYEVTLVEGDKPNALARVRESRADVLMIDLRLGSDKLHGWELLQQVRAERDLAELPVLICSGDIESLQNAEEAIADMPRTLTIRKPFALDDLTHGIDLLWHAGESGVELDAGAGA